MYRSLKTLLADLVVAATSASEAVATWEHATSIVSMREKGYEARECFLTELMKFEGITGRFSRPYLEERLQQIVNSEFVATSPGIGRGAKRVLEEVLSLATARLQQRPVNIPVFGLDIFPDEMVVQVGNVEFYTLVNREKARWISFADLDLLGRDAMNPPGGSDTWAKVKVEASDTDLPHLRSRALEETEKAMGALLLFLPAYASGDIREREYEILLPQPSIWRELVHNEKYYVFESCEHENYSARSSFDMRRKPPSLFINQEVIDAYAKNGFDYVSNVLTKPSNELQRVICQSLRLFWAASISADIAISYLTYVAMLEMLVMAPDERSIARQMPLRICWIVGENATSKNRGEIATRVKKLYSNRSIVAHGRAVDQEQFSPDLPPLGELTPDLRDLRLLAFELVRKLAKCSNYRTQKEVADWVKARDRGASISFDSHLPSCSSFRGNIARRLKTSVQNRVRKVRRVLHFAFSPRRV
jgi:hypothetical protein